MSRKNKRRTTQAAIVRAVDVSVGPLTAFAAEQMTDAYLNSRDAEEQRWHAVWSEK